MTYKPSGVRRRFELSHDGPEGSTWEMHTFCRKMSEDMIDKERIIVGIGWVLGTAGQPEDFKVAGLLSL